MGWCWSDNVGVVLLASLELRILEEVHEPALVLEDVLAVSSLAREDVVSMPFCRRIELEYHGIALDYQLAAESAELALGISRAREDVERVAVAVRACALLANQGSSDDCR